MLDARFTSVLRLWSHSLRPNILARAPNYLIYHITSLYLLYITPRIAVTIPMIPLHYITTSTNTCARIPYTVTTPRTTLPSSVTIQPRQRTLLHLLQHDGYRTHRDSETKTQKWGTDPCPLLGPFLGTIFCTPLFEIWTRGICPFTSYIPPLATRVSQGIVLWAYGVALSGSMWIDGGLLWSTDHECLGSMRCLLLPLGTK